MKNASAKSFIPHTYAKGSGGGTGLTRREGTTARSERPTVDEIANGKTAGREGRRLGYGQSAAAALPRNFVSSLMPRAARSCCWTCPHT